MSCQRKLHAPTTNDVEKTRCISLRLSAFEHCHLRPHHWGNRNRLSRKVKKTFGKWLSYFVTEDAKQETKMVQHRSGPKKPTAGCVIEPKNFAE